MSHRNACRVAGAALLAVALAAGAGRVRAEARWNGFDYLTLQHWLQAADATANEQVTHEICGWGSVDLRVPFLAAAQAQGANPLQLDDLVERHDGALRERRRLEAVLALNPANAPTQRFTGLHATDGCANSVRERIGGLRQGWR